MGILARLGGWHRREPDPAQQRGAVFSFAPGPVDPARFLSGQAASNLALRVTREEALQVPAVLRGRNLICGSLAALPLHTYDTDRNRVRSPLLEQIDPDVPNVVTLAETFEDLLFEGISWWRVKAFGWNGYPVEAGHVDVTAVSMSPPPGYPLHTLPSGAFPGGVVWVMGEPVAGSEMIRFDSPNPPLLKHAARAIRRALKLEQAADRYADEPQALGYFTPADGADPADDDEIEGILDGWQAARQTRATGYVPAALKYNALQWSPADLQLADLQLRATLALANAMGVDPEDLGVSTTSRTYQNAVDRRQDRINETYAPMLRAIEDRLSMRDVTPRGKRVRFDLDGFLKADPGTRWAAYQAAHALGAMTVDEIREEEDRPALPAGQRPAPAPAPVEAERPAERVFAREQGIAFDADESTAEFAVDEQARTITGLAVPWGKVARSGGRRWRFERGSLRWKDTGRVKLLRDHDHAQAVGRAIRLTDTAEGLVAVFKVARGPDGDRVLALAVDGVLDGLSVGIDFTDEPGDVVPDPDEQGVRLVRRAALREVSLTAMPAFDDSRISGVTASHDERDLTMADEATTAPATEPGSSNDTAAFTRAVEAFTQAVERLGQPQEPGRQPVSAVRATVREPLVYSLDGQGPSFVRDAWEAKQGRYGGAAADEALARLRKYEEQTAQAAAAASARFANEGNTTDQAQIIPPGYRPDLYVGQLPQGRPLFEAMSRGTISNATPFKVPVWVGSAGLNDTNAEGTGPSTGTITNHTYRTVTPTAQSGEFIITRELIDASNPAIDRIALAAMREEYSQDTEAIIAAALAAATDNDTGSGQSTEGCYVYTANGDGRELGAAIDDAWAAFPFTRFTVSPNRLLLSQRAFGAMVKATDDIGRKMYPFLGASNADGTTGQAAQSLSVSGLPGRPAWSLTEGTNDAVTFNSVDAWAWESPLLTFRFEEKAGPENIVLNIWAYFAFQILRYTGIHSVAYTVA